MDLQRPSMPITSDMVVPPFGHLSMTLRSTSSSPPSMRDLHMSSRFPRGTRAAHSIIPATAVALAISPASRPPIPSHTARTMASLPSGASRTSPMFLPSTAPPRMSIHPYESSLISLRPLIVLSVRDSFLP